MLFQFSLSYLYFRKDHAAIAGNCPSLTRMHPALKQHYVTLTVTQCFEKQNLMMHINMLHKTAILVKLGHILQRKYLLVFPPMFDGCSVCLQPFILAELSPAATRCCSCSFSLQAAYMLLSGTSVNHRVEAEQL